MLCPFCGAYGGQDDIVCPKCGKLLPRGENNDTGVRAIRQGKRAREAAASGQTPIWMERQGTGRVYVDPDTRPSSGGQIPVYADPEIYAADGRPEQGAGIERQDRRIYGDTASIETTAIMGPRRRRNAIHQVGRRAVNWAWVSIGIAAALLLMMMGVYLYLTRTAAGQVIMARMGRDASAAALWQVGEEKLDTGDVEGAIGDFRQAMEKDGEENVNVPGMLLLGSAYEAAGRLAEAEELYIRIYTDIVPSASEAYTNEIRILLATERKPEAADLMRLAYQKTGNNAFYQERVDLLPQQPVADLTAALYEQKKHLGLSSPEGYDIYYTFDENAALPEEGIHYDQPIFLDEGEWRLRAVCVYENLVSDELAAVYRINMPSPQAPYASLAPNTYKQRQKVGLRPGADNIGDDDIIIYYTVDGSTPDADSPVYTGEKFWLPNGRSVLKAVAVNGYGKASLALEINYKVEAQPWPKKAYTTADIGTVKLNGTTQADLEKLVGEADSYEEITLSGFSDMLRRYRYSWGYVTYQRTHGTQYVVELECHSREILGPRNTGVGDTEQGVTSQFRDMGQVESPSGNRGLYSNEDGTGKIYKQEDGSKIIRYVAYTLDSHYWRLEYHVSRSGTVDSIYMLYIP